MNDVSKLTDEELLEIYKIISSYIQELEGMNLDD